MYRSTNHLRPGLADFGQACGMAVLRTNLDAAPGLDVGLELHSRPGPNLRWNGVVEIQASGDIQLTKKRSHFSGSIDLDNPVEISYIDSQFQGAGGDDHTVA